MNERALLMLGRIGELLAGKARPEDALKTCLPKMAQLVGVDSAGVYLVKAGRAEMELAYACGVSRRFTSAMSSARIDRGLLAKIFKTSRPIALKKFSPRYPFASHLKSEGLKSVAYIPIRAGGKVRGILCLSNHKPYTFRRSILRLSLALGRQIGSAWEGALASGQAQRRRSQLESLSGLSIEFGSAGNTTHLFRRATRKAKALLAADWAGIRVLEGGKLSLVAEAGSRLGLRPSLRIGESLAGRVIQRKRPLMITDMSAVSFQLPENREAVMRRGYKAFLGVPLRFRGQIMGSLSVMRREPNEFSAEEIAFLKGVAEQAGLAFHKLKLLEEKEILHKFLSNVHLLDLHTLLDRLTERVVEFFRAEMSTIRLLDGNNQFTIRSVAASPELVTKIHAEAHRGLVGGRHEWIQKHKRPLLIADLQRDKRFPYQGSIRATQVRGFAGVPLIGREGKVLGVLTVTTLLPRRFRADEVRFLQELTSGASIAIEEAVLIDALSNTLRAKVEFLNTLSHDLRVPLNVIIGNISLMEDGFFGLLNPELGSRINLVKKNAEDLLTMLNQALSLSRLEAGGVPVHIEEFRLEDLVSEIGADMSVLAQTKGLKFERTVEIDCSVRGDGHKIKEVIYNLLSNAIKYTENGSIRLRAALESGGDQIWLEVSDTGRGIPEEELPHIFEPFHQAGSPSAHRSEGVGLGLAIVKRLLDLLGGQVEVKSALNEGSTFRVVFPRISQTHTQ